MSAFAADDPRVRAGQAVYTRRSLRLYDLVVLTLSNRWIWRCPTPRLLEQYDAYVTDRHLDAGVATGWYVDRCRFPSASPQIVLLDLNAECLARAASRLARFRPETVRANLFEPLPLGERTFDSISLTWVLHCLPGTIPEKAVVLDRLARHLAPGGTLFGATLLGRGVRRGRLAAKLMSVYDEKGIMNVSGDSLDDLRAALHDRFEDVALETVGCGALFRGRRPRRAGT